MKYLLLASLLGVAPLAAGLYFEGDLLILKPCTDQLYFTIKGPATADDMPLGKEFAVQPDYDFGYAIRLGHTFCCDRGAAEFGWENLDTPSTRKIVTTANDGDLLWDILSAPDNGFLNYADGFAKARAVFDYFSMHATGKWALNPGGCLLATLCGGLRYAKIKFRENVLYLDAENSEATTVLNTSRTWGIGPYVGVRGDYHLWCGIGLFASVDVGLLAGRIDSGSFQETTLSASDEDVVDVSKEQVCRQLCHYGFEAGLSSSACMGCVKLTAACGYQVREYLSAIQNVSFYSRIREGASSTGDNPFDLSGFFVRLQLEL